MTTAATSPVALDLSRRLLKILMVLNPLGGLIVLGLFVFSFTAEAELLKWIAGGGPAVDPAILDAMRMIAIIGLVSVPLAQIVLARLRAIVETAGQGDPFVAANATRLRMIARILLGLECLHLAVGALSSFIESDARLHMDWTFSITPWLAILLLFVLARVFEAGSAMRADLEGTV